MTGGVTGHDDNPHTYENPPSRNARGRAISIPLSTWVFVPSLRPRSFRSRHGAPASDLRGLRGGRAFWTSLGAVAVQNGNLQLLQLPGTFVMVRQGQPGRQHRFDDRPRHIPGARCGWLGEVGWCHDRKRLGDGPDGIVASSESGPHIGRQNGIIDRDRGAGRGAGVCVKQFGAAPGKAGGLAVADLPGVRLEFVRAATAPAPTKGRALDHIGFEVRNLEEFCKKLEASGQKLDRPFTRLPNSATAIAFLTDPWGTYIEITENLAPPK